MSKFLEQFGTLTALLAIVAIYLLIKFFWYIVGALLVICLILMTIRLIQRYKDVKYFKKYHNVKIKFWNFCDFWDLLGF